MREPVFRYNLKKIRLIVFKWNSLRSNQFMTRDNYQQFWYTGVVLITKTFLVAHFTLCFPHTGNMNSIKVHMLIFSWHLKFGELSLQPPLNYIAGR